MTEQSFELRLVCSKRVIEAPVSSATQKRREDAETARKHAAQYAFEALLATVSTMRTTKNELVRLRAAKEVMDRAWGVPKTTEDANEDIKNQSIIELLASMSTSAGALTGPAAQPVQRLASSDPTAIEGLLVKDSDA